MNVAFIYTNSAITGCANTFINENLNLFTNNAIITGYANNTFIN